MSSTLPVQPAIVGTALNQSGSVNLSFVNTKATPATEVDFALIAHNEVVRTATLKGTFSKGITIKKAWTTTVTDVNQSAAITKVVFADGTTWAKPAVP